MGAATLPLHGPWTADRIAGAYIAAALPSLAVVFYERGIAERAPSLLVALIVTFGWQFVFVRSRGTPLGWDGIVTAIALIVMLPDGVPLWQTALATTFGVVVGEQIFGGRGRAFLNPAAVALAFFYFSFPAGVTAERDTGLIALATIPGAILLVVLGIASWRIVLAAFAGLAVAGFLTGVDSPTVLLTSGSFAFGLIFLGCDPVSAAATIPGRLIYGLLIGVLSIVFGVAEASAVIFAVLLASIFAPLIDHAVVWLHAFRRSRRNG